MGIGDCVGAKASFPIAVALPIRTNQLAAIANFGDSPKATPAFAQIEETMFGRSAFGPSCIPGITLWSKKPR